jgi:hypothetical protein
MLRTIDIDGIPMTPNGSIADLGIFIQDAVRVYVWLLIVDILIDVESEIVRLRGIHFHQGLSANLYVRVWHQIVLAGILHLR